MLPEQRKQAFLLENVQGALNELRSQGANISGANDSTQFQHDATEKLLRGAEVGWAQHILDLSDEEILQAVSRKNRAALKRGRIDQGEFLDQIRAAAQKAASIGNFDSRPILEGSGDVPGVQFKSDDEYVDQSGLQEWASPQEARDNAAAQRKAAKRNAGVPNFNRNEVYDERFNPEPPNIANKWNIKNLKGEKRAEAIKEEVERRRDAEILRDAGIYEESVEGVDKARKVIDRAAAAREGKNVRVTPQVMRPEMERVEYVDNNPNYIDPQGRKAPNPNYGRTLYKWVPKLGEGNSPIMKVVKANDIVQETAPEEIFRDGKAIARVPELGKTPQQNRGGKHGKAKHRGAEYYGNLPYSYDENQKYEIAREGLEARAAVQEDARARAGQMTEGEFARAVRKEERRRLAGQEPLDLKAQVFGKAAYGPLVVARPGGAVEAVHEFDRPYGPQARYRDEFGTHRQPEAGYPNWDDAAIMPKSVQIRRHPGVDADWHRFDVPGVEDPIIEATPPTGRMKDKEVAALYSEYEKGKVGRGIAHEARRRDVAFDASNALLEEVKRRGFPQTWAFDRMGYIHELGVTPNRANHAADPRNPVTSEMIERPTAVKDLERDVYLDPKGEVVPFHVNQPAVKTPNSPDAGQNLNAPQNVRDFVMENRPGYDEGGRVFGNLTQIDIGAALDRFRQGYANLNSDQFGGRGTLGDINSVEGMQVALDNAMRAAAEHHVKFKREDPNKPGVRRIVDQPGMQELLGKMRYTPAEREALAGALAQLELGRRQGASTQDYRPDAMMDRANQTQQIHRADGKHRSIVGKFPLPEINRNAADAMNGYDDRARLAKIVNEKVDGKAIPAQLRALDASKFPMEYNTGVDGKKNKSPVAMDELREVQKVLNDAQMPLIGAIAGEVPEVFAEKYRGIGPVEARKGMEKMYAGGDARRKEKWSDTKIKEEAYNRAAKIRDVQEKNILVDLRNAGFSGHRLNQSPAGAWPLPREAGASTAQLLPKPRRAVNPNPTVVSDGLPASVKTPVSADPSFRKSVVDALVNQNKRRRLYGGLAAAGAGAAVLGTLLGRGQEVDEQAYGG